jgi:hypothetical protein
VKLELKTFAPRKITIVKTEFVNYNYIWKVKLEVKTFAPRKIYSENGNAWARTSGASGQVTWH